MLRGEKLLVLGKKGISPLVATVLLVGLAVAIILIITFWGRNIYEEQAEKSSALASSERKCTETSIDVEVISNGVRVLNTGGIPIKGIFTREEYGDDLTRLNTIYVEVAPGDFFDLVYGDCGDGVGPATGICSNLETVRIWAGQQTGGYRDEPLVICEPEKTIQK